MSNNLIVAKFGGTSVADFDAMHLSTNIIASLYKNTRLLVILSASAGITNILISLSQGLEKEKRISLLNKIQEINDKIINQITCSDILINNINIMFKDITRLSEIATITTSAALKDELISYGEIFSTLLFVEILKKYKMNAKWFDVRKVMRTDNQFGHAKPDLLEIKKQVIMLLEPCLYQRIIVTQGFIGSEKKGHTTTLGRGGSDYSAALLGEALDATRVDIWTDVAGIYTTDPRIVSTAKRISEITFNEAAEMAKFGAKVLHPATLLPALRSNIPVFVGSSKNLEAGGTQICNNIKHPPLFRAITLRRNQILVTLHSLNMLHTQGFLAEVFNILARYNISVDLITTSQVSIALILDNTHLELDNDHVSLFTKIILNELSSLCTVTVEENLALIAIIGNNLSYASGFCKEIFDSIKNFKLRMICYGASTHNLCFLAPTEDAEKIIHSLHHHLFGC